MMDGHRGKARQMKPEGKGGRKKNQGQCTAPGVPSAGATYHGASGNDTWEGSLSAGKACEGCRSGKSRNCEVCEHCGCKGCAVADPVGRWRSIDEWRREGSSQRQTAEQVTERDQDERARRGDCQWLIRP